MKLTYKIQHDLSESQINLRVALAFIPIAFLTFIFHEFGHWTLGELTGNDMRISLNYSSPLNGSYLNDYAALWSSIGGPMFTIIQAFVFTLIVVYSRSVYAFSVVFFAFFARFFPILFGGFQNQDEYRIAEFLKVSPYLIAMLVLTILTTLVILSARKCGIKLKYLSYYFMLSTIAILIVIAFV